MRKIFFVVSFFLLAQSTYSAIPAFPMTIYGNLKVGTTDLGAGTVLSFQDGDNSSIGTYTTTRVGSYGFESTIAGLSPTFSEYSGALQIRVQYLGQNYAISSIVGTSQDCPIASSIVFVSDVCRYDITVTAPIPPPPAPPAPSGGSPAGGSSSFSALPTVPPPPATTIVLPSQAPVGTTSVISPISQQVVVVTARDIKKSKMILTQTALKKGTVVTLYRILPSGRQIRIGKSRVLPNGKVRFAIRIAGKYRLDTK